MLSMWWMVSGILIMGVLSIYDIRTKKIPVYGFAVVFVYSLISVFCFGDRPEVWTDVGLSIIPGLMLIGLSVITEGKVGVGDGIIIAALGPGLGFERCVYMLTLALIFNCIFAGVLLALHKVKPKTRIPFVPFVTMSMGVISFVFR